ncbi:MAG: 2-oxo-4-hydroxy-4-carboxy-5-ureidoimidazoline decarboxylase [Gorillibacterium sp.]|nr:2-oxo-4-hydroxy-4-carboxy-5-ureidoimidazoline decarboxylase [Gorillibacterium sp.]
MTMTKEEIIEMINNLSKEAFLRRLGWVFEHSPWVMERVWRGHPFPSLEKLMHRMEQTVREGSTKREQLELLRAHPNLAGRLAMSKASEHEQQGAGLDKLSPEVYALYSACNQAYMDKYNIPFIMAVRNQNKDSILTAMQQRLAGEQETEYVTALEEVIKIAQFRLMDTLEKE